MIDLHLHTKYSDGADSIIEILKKAEEKQLEIISITDHNNCHAYEELKKINIKDYFKGVIIRGVELKTIIEGTHIELLGYGVNPDIINAEIENMYISKEKHKKIEFERLYKKCIDIGIIFNENIIADYNPDKYAYASMYILEKIAEKNENKKIVDEDALSNHDTFFRKYMSNPDSILYMDYSDLIPSPNSVIKLIKDAGGLVFIPHIYIYGSNSDKIFKVLTDEYKIDGIECIYPLFSKKQSEYLLDFCKKNELYISGGSDYHGTAAKPDLQMGMLNIKCELIKDWIDKVIID